MTGNGGHGGLPGWGRWSRRCPICDNLQMFTTVLRGSDKGIGMDRMRWLAGSFAVVLAAGLTTGACGDDSEGGGASTSTSTSSGTGGTAGSGGQGGTASGSGGQGGTASGSGGQAGAGGQGGSIFVFECGSAQGGGGPGGAGGQGGTAPGGGGQGGGGCVTCLGWLTTGADPATICDASCAFAEPLYDCACITECGGPCGENVCLGSAPSGGCSNCLASNCVTELAACSGDS